MCACMCMSGGRMDKLREYWIVCSLVKEFESVSYSDLGEHRVPVKKTSLKCVYTSCCCLLIAFSDKALFITFYWFFSFSYIFQKVSFSKAFQMTHHELCDAENGDQSACVKWVVRSCYNYDDMSVSYALRVGSTYSHPFVSICTCLFGKDTLPQLREEGGGKTTTVSETMEYILTAVALLLWYLLVLFFYFLFFYGLFPLLNMMSTSYVKISCISPS